MVVKIEVPFGALSIIRHLMDMVPKKRANFGNDPYGSYWDRYF